MYDSIASIVLSVLPIIAVLVFVYRMDVDREPRANLIRTFLFGFAGMIPALFVAFPIRLLDLGSPTPFLDVLLASFVLVAIPGEFIKMLVLRYYCYRLRAFDELMDGIVYGAVAAMGFAVMEPVMFSTPRLWFMSPLRAVTSVPLHAATGAIIGYSMAHWMFVRHSTSRVWKGWGIAAVSHGLYNIFCLYPGIYEYNGGSSRLIIEGFPILAIAVVVALGVWVLRTTRRLRNKQLIEHACGEPTRERAEPTYFQMLRARRLEARDADNRARKN
ncbi:PrsW family intramembrane metalloprotease [Candidatus Bipolaricaulota bacterium]